MKRATPGAVAGTGEKIEHSQMASFDATLRVRRPNIVSAHTKQKKKKERKKKKKSPMPRREIGLVDAAYLGKFSARPGGSTRQTRWKRGGATQIRPKPSQALDPIRLLGSSDKGLTVASSDKVVENEKFPEKKHGTPRLRSWPFLAPGRTKGTEIRGQRDRSALPRQVTHEPEARIFVQGLRLKSAHPETSGESRVRPCECLVGRYFGHYSAVRTSDKASTLEPPLLHSGCTSPRLG